MLSLVPSPRPRDARITSRQNPLVARFREAARSAAGPLLLEGPHLVAEALDAGITLEVLAVAGPALERPEVAGLVSRVPDVVVASAIVLDAMSPARTASGVLALARRPDPADMEDVFRGAPPLVVIAVSVQDPGNVGAIVRAAEAGGASGVIATRDGADPYGWKALRGAMGSAFRLPLVRGKDGGEAIRLARSRGLRIVAATSRGGTPMAAAGLDGPVALLVGGEGGGLSDALLAAADDRITIPMAPPVESLNVAVAAALLVYEARRQRVARQSAGS